MKKLLALPILFLLICCAARDRKILSDFMSEQKEVQNGDSIYIIKDIVSKEFVLDIYYKTYKLKEAGGSMETYYYSPNTLSWPYTPLQVHFMSIESRDSIWRKKDFKYSIADTISTERFNNHEFHLEYLEKKRYPLYTFSQPVVKGKNALLYFSSGYYLGVPQKQAVFVLRKNKGKWHIVGEMYEKIN